MRVWLAFLTASVLCACASLPESPPVSELDTTAIDFARLGNTSAEQVRDDWWRLYDVSQLDELVAASLRANADLRVAYSNLASARALSRQAELARLPQTTIDSGLKVDNTRSQPSASAVPATDWDLGITASWQVDLFGRLRAASLAAEADREAMQAALDGVKVAVVADTVQAFVDLCAMTDGLAVANDVADRQQGYVELLKRQLAAGEVSQLEVAQAATQSATLRAAIPPFAAGRMNALYRLATLQGLPPNRGLNFGIECSASPRLRTAAAVGDGTALLMRRPDVKEAERRLAAAAARVGIARADLYPQLNLGGALGLLDGSFSNVATPLVQWSFPNQGPARARIAQARASERAALANWDRIVLNALSEVETAIANYDSEQQRNLALSEATVEAQAYAGRATARVRLGDASGLLQLDAERTLASSRLALVLSDLALSRSEVALFRALGGGWRTGDATR